MRLEAHLTYRCDLACHHCNRGCRLRTDHTPDLSLEDLRRAIGTSPSPVDRIVLIGGEPTLHPLIVDFAALAKATCQDVRIYSNAYRPEARDFLDTLKAMGIHNSGGTDKPNGSIEHGMKTGFWSPADAGITRDPCTWAGNRGCGYSVDALGITACAIGGAVDGILGLGLRTWDWSKVDARLPDLCRHCGANYDWQTEPETFTFRGQRVSRTWLDALKHCDEPDA